MRQALRLWRGWALAGLVAAALLGGCSTAPDGDSGSQGDPTELYGGYTTDPESPGFGDPGLLAAHPEDQPYDDEMERNPEVRAAAGDSRTRKYMVRLVWGNLEKPDTTMLDCPVTEWSGSVVADGGVILVRRLVRFEPGDYIVRPRRGAREVRWVSHTAGGVDGVLLEVIDVHDPSSQTDAVSNSITVATPLYSVEIPFDSLAAYAQTVTIDGCNQIAITSTEATRVRCPRGFLEGAWTSESDTSGRFEGGWIRDDGALDGHLRGRYVERDGERLLFGKWITSSGEFGGLLRGTWGPMPEVDAAGGHDAPDGYFAGHWVNAALTAEGVFRGHYCLPEAPDTTGFFHGRWARDCR